MRGWLLVVLLLLCTAPAGAQPLVQMLPKGSTASTVPIEVPAIGESRLALQFDLPLAVSRITLIDPTGAARELALGRDVHVIDAALRRQKEQGNQYLLLSPLPNPAPGRWQLQIVHPPARGGERLQVLASQFPRFELRLALVGGDQQRIGAGSERLVELRASDQGRPATGLQVLGSALHTDSGARTPLPFWSERPASYDLPVQTESGQVFAVFAPEAAGRHSIEAAVTFTGSDGRPQTLRRQIDLAVAPQTVLQTLRVEQPAGPAGCVPRVGFGIDWPAQAAGRYSLALVLKGSLRTQQLSGGVIAQGPGRLLLQAGLSARELLALGDNVQVLRLDLLHLTDSGFELLQRRRGLRLDPPLASAALCR